MSEPAYPEHRVVRAVQTRTTNADSSLRRRRRSEFREYQDRHSNHCGEADERTSGNYGQTAILSDGGVHVRLYLHTCTRVPNCHYNVGNGGQIRCRGTRRRGQKGRDLVRRGREIGKTCKGCARERGVGEMNEGRGGGGGGGGRGNMTERTREKRAREAEKGKVVREKERGPLKITSYTLFQTDHLR